MGIIVIRKRNTEKTMSVKALGEKLDKEIKYFGSYKGTIVEGGAEVSYRRVGANMVAEVAPMSW